MALKWAKAESRSCPRWSEVTESNLGLNPQVAKAALGCSSRWHADRSKQLPWSSAFLSRALTCNGLCTAPNSPKPILVNRLQTFALHCCRPGASRETTLLQVAQMGSLEKQKSTQKYVRVLATTTANTDIWSTSGIWSTTEMCLELLKKWGREQGGIAVSAEGRLGHPGMSSQLLSGLLSVRPSSDSSQQHKAKQVR